MVHKNSLLFSLNALVLIQSGYHPVDTVNVAAMKDAVEERNEEEESVKQLKAEGKASVYDVHIEKCL